MAATVALLQQYCPVYYFDARETIPLVNLESYAFGKADVRDNSVTGVVRYTNTTTDLHYFAFYLQDGGTSVLNTRFTVGDHAYDIEHLVVQIDNASRGVIAVIYQPHGTKEHFAIRDKDDIEAILSKGLRPVVFVARGKHANYPTPGTIWRYFGMANDYCNPATLEDAKVTVNAASTQLQSIRTIDGGKFRALRDRLAVDLNSKPSIRLAKVATRLRFAFP